jgi:CRISPR/Cas system Type II protein with McrA/HNH and RuvC-like nuclease domain
MTPGYVRNAIRRSLSAIVDREPGKREVAKLWRHFASKCAYCGKALKPGPGANIDHLVPASKQGAHHISNRVLACATCDNRKGNRLWRAHLKTVAPNAMEANRRTAKIEKWAKLMAPSVAIADKKVVEREAERVLTTFNTAVEKLRRAVSPKRAADA